MNIAATPIPKFSLYIPANKTNSNKISFPKIVSNKLTNIPGIAYITSHKNINKVK